MKAKIFAMLGLTVILAACSRGTEVTVNDLQGSWTTDCINDNTGFYTTTIVFKGQAFSLYDAMYTQQNCAGTAKTGETQSGTFEINGTEIDWIMPGSRSYGVIEMEGKDIIRFGSFAGQTPETRPTAVSQRPYRRNY